jgi:hypothetical protein
MSVTSYGETLVGMAGVRLEPIYVVCDNERLVLPIGNPKQRQSYFGALNGMTGEVLVKAVSRAYSTHTIAFLQHLRAHYPDKQLWVIWDNASYHKSQLVKEYLQQLNQNLPEEKWPLSLISLAFIVGRNTN